MTPKQNGNGNSFDEMVAIQLVIKGWPGRVSLTPEDAGLKPEDFDEEIMHLGNKKLYSKDWRKRFTDIHGAARRYLDKHTIAFVLEWVRATGKRNLANLMPALDKYQADYMALGAEFIDCFSTIQDEWKAKIIEKYGDEKGTQIWERMLPHYPTLSWLKRRFRFEVNVFDLKAAEPPKKGSAPEVVEAYNRAKADLQERLDDMVEEAILYLRKKVADTVTNLSNRLKEGLIIRNDTLESVRKVEAWFAELNIFGDRDVDLSLKKLRDALEGTDAESLKSNDGFKAQLAAMADNVVAAASNIQDVNKLTGNYKRRIDLS